MKNLKYLFLFIVILTLTFSCSTKEQNNNPVNLNNMIIRISEIEIDTNSLDVYLAILKEESEASVRLEPGVISIYPLYQKENPTEIRILEIYADTAAYKSHLQTPHFKHYKTTTMNMVKSLTLVDMTAIDFATMPRIFKKLN